MTLAQTERELRLAAQLKAANEAAPPQHLSAGSVRYRRALQLRGAHPLSTSPAAP